MIVLEALKPKVNDEEEEDEEENADMIDKFRESFKIQVIYTMLASIHFHSFQTYKVRKPKFLNYTDEEENLRLPISGDLIGDERPELIKEIEKKKYGLLEGLLTVYSPSKFENIISIDSNREEITESLNLENNFKNIIKSGVNGGGKSGEFFFFSEDNSLIIKTITNHELTVLLRILPDYIVHLKANKKSMLAKIYGAYTIETNNPYERYNIILMKNVSGYPKHCIRRTFDLKGSTYGRGEINDIKVRKEKIKDGQILKDLDFDRFEGQLHIDNHMGIALAESLENDAEFLRKHKLIDYSMIVLKIEHFLAVDSSFLNTSGLDVRRTQSDFGLPDQSVKNDLGIMSKRGETGSELKVYSNPLSVIKSTKEDLHYHIGIIDYLNDYSIKKKLEVFFRKCLKCNSKLDLSVQNPNFYAQRFLKYTKKIIFG